MGYDIQSIEALQPLGQDAYSDAKAFIGSDKSPVVFDVGANLGQTIDLVRERFPSSIIHAFEPGQIAFNRLVQTHPRLQNVHLNNFALGSKIGRKRLFENSTSEMSSLLPLGPDGWGEIKAQREVEVSTVDTYCQEHAIRSIDLLKSDTQGFDLKC